MGHLDRESLGKAPRAQAVGMFFENNRATIDRECLAAVLRKIVVEGPKKTTRVPLLDGHTNTGKSTHFDPLDEVFCFRNVMHRPALGSRFGLANIRQRGKRFLYWDDYRPVEYAATGTVPVPTFLSLFQGYFFEVTVSQSFHDGNPDLRWTRGAAMTAKLKDCRARLYSKPVRTWSPERKTKCGTCGRYNQRKGTTSIANRWGEPHASQQSSKSPELLLRLRVSLGRDNRKKDATSIASR